MKSISEISKELNLKRVGPVRFFWHIMDPPKEAKFFLRMRVFDTILEEYDGYITNKTLKEFQDDLNYAANMEYIIRKCRRIIKPSNSIIWVQLPSTFLIDKNGDFIYDCMGASGVITEDYDGVIS